MLFKNIDTVYISLVLKIRALDPTSTVCFRSEKFCLQA
jgi:hypothetical protein